MSFSSGIKDELASLRVNSAEERAAMLCALTHTAASMRLGRGLSIEYVSENPGVAALIERLLSEREGISATISVREQEGLRSKNTIVTATGGACEALLRECGCLPEEGDEEYAPGKVPHAFMLGEKNAKAFLRGAFLGNGSISNPAKGYHLEFVCRYERFAEELSELLNDFELNARVTTRKSNFVVYLKEGESIADFLRLAGAVEGIFSFENIRMMRFTVNNLNRQSNFEEANMQKAAKAAAQQLRDIEEIRRTEGLDSLPPPLRQTAEARINNPEATLMELAEELEIGKSGVVHRLARLSKIADDIRLHGSPAKENMEDKR